MATTKPVVGLRGKIILIFALSMVLVLGLAGDGLWESFKSIREFDRDVMAEQGTAVSVEAMEVTFKKQVQEWKDLLLRGKNPDAFQKYWTNFQNRESDVRAQGEKLVSLTRDQDAKQLLEQFLTAHAGMAQAYRAGLDKFTASGFDGSAGDQAVAGIDRQPTELLTKARERIVASAASHAGEVSAHARAALWWNLGLLVGGAVVSLALFFVILQKAVTGPLIHMVEVIDMLATGNTDVVVEGSERSDEVGELARSVGVFRDDMIQMARMRRQQEDADARAAAERKRIMQALADRFEQAVMGLVRDVSSQSSEMVTTLAAMTEGAQQTSLRASTVAAAATQASVNVETVAAAAEELSASIGEISRQVSDAASVSASASNEAEQTNARMEALASAASKITDVVNLINDIAAQTNLLALNATIEAARAGDAGKGFAVVANEVKSLANQTARATEEITSQINGVQAETHDAVEAIRTIGSVIVRVRQISSGIAAAVEQQGAATQEIARNVQEAFVGTSDVSSNIQGIARTADDAGAASQQMLSASGRLASNAETLRIEVTRFLAEVRAG